MTNLNRKVATRRTLIVATATSALLAVGLAACGDSSESDETAGRDTRTIEVEMLDADFIPGRIEVNDGETVQFVFTNHGTVAHDAFIGDADAQSNHEDEMRAAMEMDQGDHAGHGKAEAITVEPGDNQELTHTFNDTGTTEIGCHQNGHYDAGMRITVEVT